MKRVFPCGHFTISTDSSPGVHLRVKGFPAPLVAGPFPNRHQPDWFVLQQAGIRHIVCLASTQPDLRYDPCMAGLSWLAKEDMPELADLMEPGGAAGIWQRAFEVASDDEARKARRQDRAKLLQIAQSVLAALWRGEGVFLHCEYGQERTGVLISLVLKLVCGDADEATDAVARGLSPHSSRSDDLANRYKDVLTALYFDARF